MTQHSAITEAVFISNFIWYIVHHRFICINIDFLNTALLVNILSLDYWHLHALLNFAPRHSNLSPVTMFTVLSGKASCQHLDEGAPPVPLTSSVAALPTGRSRRNYLEEALLDNHCTTKCSLKQYSDRRGLKSPKWLSIETS